MSKENIIKNIELIDGELKRNEEFIKEHQDADVTILHVTSKLLRDARKMWTDMLLCEYGVYYV